MAASAVTIVADNLVTGYRRGRVETVVSRASFQLEAGRIIAVIGPNGAGKTTLLKTLIGVLSPLSGTLLIDGLSPLHYRQRIGVGYLPEGLSIDDAWTARGLMALAALAGGPAAQESMAEASELAGVDFDIDRPLAQMSKGMRQRVALTLALMPLPQVLLLDEPEAGLDPAQRIGLRDRLRRFAHGGRIVIVASHDVTGLASMADQAYLLTQHTFQPVKPGDLSDPARLLELFGLEARA